MASKSDRGKSKAHAKPLKRLSAQKNDAQKSNAKLQKGPNITSFFKNTPPSKLACPLCGNFIPRFKINDHIDSQCRDFLDETNIQAGTVREQEKTSWPFSKKSPQSPDKEKHGDMPENNQEEKTSPYFKKSGTTRQESPKNISHDKEVKIISLGRLSSKLSKKVLFASEDTQVSVKEETILSEPSSSQKENFDENSSVTSEQLLKNSTLTSQVPPEHLPELEKTDPAKPKAGSLTSDASSSAENAASLRLKKRKNEESPGAGGAPAMQKKTRFLGKRSAKTGCSKQVPDDDVCTSELKGVEQSHITALDEGSDLPQDAGAKTVEQSSPRRPYYLQNFLTVLETVLENKDDCVLFSEEELSSIQRFKMLSGRQCSLVHN